MATVTLGNIKFNWKGPYNNSTAYVVDDVVSSGGSSYVCILASTGNAVSNGTYWQQMSAAGTNGTDLTSTLTTQGDIVYRDGSGLARLGYGTAGQVLQTGGSGANPSWGTVSSDFVKLASATGNGSANEISIDGFYSTDYIRYVLYGRDVKTSSSGDDLNFRTNQSGSTNGSSVYVNTNGYLYTDTTPSHGMGVVGTSVGSNDFNAPADRWDVNADDFPAGTEDVCNFELHIHNPLTVGVWKTVNWHSHFVRNDQNTMQSFFGMGVWKSTQANTGITIKLKTGNLTGDFRLYGIKA